MPMIARECARLTTTDGRGLCVAVYGPQDGRPVLWHHGNPGCRFPPFTEDVLDSAGVRLISFDRPGCGRSDSRPGRRIAEVIEDVALISEALALERFWTAGFSAGGAYTLATAALLPDRVVGAAVLAGAAPVDAAGLDFGADMTADNRSATGLLDVDRPSALRALEASRQEILTDPQAALLRFSREFPASDRDTLLTTGLLAVIAEQMAESVRRSADGWLDDSIVFAAPWAFDPAAITAPVTLWHGREDTAVPFAHACWLADRIPNAELHELTGGHYAPLLVATDALRQLIRP